MNTEIATPSTASAPAAPKVGSKGLKIARYAVAVVAMIVGITQLVGGVNSFIPDGGKPTTPFSVENVKLTTAHAQGAGQYTARTSNVIRSGTGFFIYFEPRNLSTNHNGQEITSNLSVDVVIQDQTGNAVVGQDNAWQLPFQAQSTSHRSIAKAWSSLEVPALNLADGKYTMTLRIHDEVARTHVDRKIEVEYSQTAALANLAPNPVR
jgi:hypothetical protein